MVSGKQAFDLIKVQTDARQISAHASGAMALFPDTAQSRNSEHSEAAPANWKKMTNLQPLR